MTRSSSDTTNGCSSVGKALNTRISYTLDARQFAKFVMDKPLTSATKEDVRGFIAEMYGKGLKPQTMQRKLDSLRVLGRLTVHSIERLGS